MLQFKKLMNTKGFTLVELLIVIAVIGILAVAVLAALDPIEQLRKSRDTGRLADARELVNAYTRFYASKNCMPHDWTSGAAIPCAAPATPVAAVQASTLTADTSHLGKMITEGELKATYRNKQSLPQLYVGISSISVASVCFEAESKNMKSLPLAQRYGVLQGAGTNTGETTAATGDCAASYTGGNVANCMICVQ
jgi:prepilin-type N-terminal cleavage/methylation domain-containing protein